MLGCVQVKEVTEMVVHIYYCIKFNENGGFHNNFITIMLINFEIQRTIAPQLSIPSKHTRGQRLQLDHMERSKVMYYQDCSGDLCSPFARRVLLST